ncbi:MAG: GntR family transcriptional regulator, partial [Elusimicrobia bacterium]|nr:GntR family transcriptional regulator [Elusimicrobiota bacterium]
MEKQENIPLFNLLFSLAETSDLVSPLTANHHLRTAYIALSLAEELGMSSTPIREAMGRLVQEGYIHHVPNVG